MLSRVYIIYLGLETIRSIRGTRTNDHALLLEISFPLVKIVETSKVVATYGVCMTYGATHALICLLFEIMVKMNKHKL